MSVRRLATEIGRDCLVMRARRLARGLTRIYDEELRPFGIGAAQINLLVTLGALGPVRASEIGARLDIEKSTLSRTLARLDEQGLLQSDDDQRLSLTAAGEQLLRDSRSAWQRAQARATAELGPRLARAIEEIPA